MIIGTSSTWSYINSQLDRSRRYAIHIATDDNLPLCGHGRPLDETMESSGLSFARNGYACKHCLRMMHKMNAERNYAEKQRSTTTPSAANGARL